MMEFGKPYTSPLLNEEEIFAEWKRALAKRDDNEGEKGNE